MDKYVFGIVIRTETGMIFREYGSGTMGDIALWMNTVYSIYRDHGQFFSMPEAAFKHILELQQREGT